MGLGGNTITEGFRLSPQQRDLWARRSGSDDWNRTVAVVRVDGPLQPDIFFDAWNEVVERYEILHTTYRSLPGMTEPLQALGDALLGWKQERRRAEGEDPEALLLSALEIRQDLEAKPALHLRLIPHGPKLHTLVLALPSLSADWLSLEKLLDVTIRTYRAHLEDGDISGEEVFQYADIAEWANEELLPDANPDALRFWKGRRRDLPPDPAPPVVPGAGGTGGPALTSRLLPPSVVAALEAVAGKAGTTPEVVALTCWSLLLARLSGQQEIPLALGFHGRSYDELHHAVGQFLRHVPFRLLVHPATSFQRLVEAAAGQWKELEAWHEFFAWQGEDGTAGRPPACAFEAWRAPGKISAAGVSLHLERAAVAVGGFAARLVCCFSEAGLRVDLYSDSARLPDGGGRMLERFVELLEQVLAKPQDRADSFSALSALEERERLAQATGPRLEIDSEQDIVQRVRHWAETTPDQPAVVFEERTLSYQQLDRRARTLAAWLLAEGVGPGTVVGLQLERSDRMIVALLAVLQAGGTYLPLDRTVPPVRAAAVLEDAGARLLLHEGEEAPPLPPGCRALDLDRRPPVAELVPELPEVDPRSAAYILFTSGSTGRPKGVVVGRRQLTNYVCALARALELPEGISYATVSTLAADLGNTAIFSALHGGGAVHVVAEERLTDAGALGDLFRRQPVDCLKIVPSHLRALLAAAPAAELLPRRWLICGGEALDWELVDTVRDLRPECRIVNHYGPTESTVGATVFEVPAAGGSTAGGSTAGDSTENAEELRSSSATVPVGRPLPNLRGLVLDEGMQLRATGGEGELYLGGAGLAEGYCGLPGRTAERFVPDPYGTEPGQRLYRTGDRVRLHPGGLLEYRGRGDDQVKIRGFRVEPGEVAAALRRHPGLSGAAVTVLEDEEGDKLLGAYLVPAEPAAAPVCRLLEMESRGATRGALSTTLPDGTAIYHLRDAETSFLYDEIFQRRVYVDHGIDLWPGACVFDVGANIGMFTLFAAQQAPGGTVYSVEPVPGLAEILRLNTQLHGVEGQILACGVRSEAGEMEMIYFPRMSVLSSFEEDLGDTHRKLLQAVLEDQGGEGATAEDLEALLDETLRRETLRVPVKTLSQLLRETAVERVDLLKIDVQHSEMEALEGVEAEDWQRIGQVVVEVYESDDLQHQIERLLEAYGFTVETAVVMQGEFDVLMIFGRRPDWPRGKAAAVEPSRWRSREALLESVREHLSEHLPEPMVPSAFGFLSRLPLTANGKVDRAALPPLSTAQEAGRAPYQEPSTPTEKALAALWEEVLKVPQVGADDDFFALGGHSLLATRLIARIRADLGASVTLRDFFNAPSVALLAKVVDRFEVSDESSRPKIQARSRDAYRRKRSSGA